MTTNVPLRAFARNVHSQNGEDGIIEEILKRLSRTSPVDNWCVEFGAWDGMHLSNTYNLINAKGYRAVLIEADKNKFRSLCQNIPRQDVYKVCQFVGLEGDATLDRILGATPIPADFDLLSIDIDGCDYFVFDSLQQYRPKIVCIEYNPTIPNEIEFVQPKDFKIKQGASAKALTLLAARKGYSLVAVTLTNLIFLREELHDLVAGPQKASLEALRDDTPYKTYVFIGYDGTVLSNRPQVAMPWHGFSPDLRAFQQLPRMLRKLPSDYNLLQKVLFAFLLATKSPGTLKNQIRAKSKRMS